MKHRKKGKKLGRNTNQRKALFRSLISSLIIHEEIKTTQSKAKAVKRLIDKLIAKARVGSLHVRRQILAFLPNKQAAHKLVDEIAPRFKTRSGGFTKLTRLGKRRGDDAMMVRMELTKKKQPEPKVKEGKKAKTIKADSKIDQGKAKIKKIFSKKDK